ncbi:MAG TPA: biotin/lipoyl-containing protein [Caproiciproducens sp.]|nr:biotin/lipoyl-containing protein [Caproiciproducens sp.]
MRNLRITVNGTAYDVQVEEVGSFDAPAKNPTGTAKTFSSVLPAVPAAVQVPVPVARPAVPADVELISSPMPGTIVSVNVQENQEVKKGDALLVLEAMKMENEIMAPHDSVVAAIHVNKGDSVESGTPLISLR